MKTLPTHYKPWNHPVRVDKPVEENGSRKPRDEEDYRVNYDECPSNMWRDGGAILVSYGNQLASPTNVLLVDRLTFLLKFALSKNLVFSRIQTVGKEKPYARLVSGLLLFR